jgi:hypothetical protein
MSTILSMGIKGHYRPARIPSATFWGFVVIGFLFELGLFMQIEGERYASDLGPTAADAITNLVAAGITLLIGTHVIRRGSAWQRVVGFCICAYPVYVFCEHIAWAGNLMSSKG